jgi:hypothetical protein
MMDLRTANLAQKLFISKWLVKQEQAPTSSASHKEIEGRAVHLG